MATTTSKPKDEEPSKSKKDKGEKLSPEGVPYQESMYPAHDDVREDEDA